MRRNIFIKITAAAMSALMLCTSACTAVTVSAEKAVSENEESDRMKTALAKVKRRFTVPEHVSEFSYEYEYDFSSDCFCFTWATPDGASEPYESYDITIIGDIIVSYRYYKTWLLDQEYTPSFAKLTDEELISKAKNYLKKLNPDVYAKGVYTLTDIQLDGNEACVQFQRKENGIIVDGNGFKIILDKDTGELYSIDGCWWDNTEFPDVEEMLTMEELRQEYKKNCRLTPVYRITYDKDWKTKGVIVYHPDNDGEMNAFTGKNSSIWSDMSKDKGVSENPHGFNYRSHIADGVDSSYEDVTSDAGTEGDYFGDVEFTEEELEKIDESKEFLSRSQLKEILCSDPYFKLSKDAELKSYELYEDDSTQEKYYALCYEAENYYADVFVNAKTGEIDFYDRSYTGKLSDKEPYPVEECLETAKSAVKHFYPEICGEYRSAAENKEPSYCRDDKSYETRRNFVFRRYVNGIEVEGDTINVSVTNDGQVTDVDYYYTEAEFEQPAEFDRDKAFEKLFGQLDIKLYYDGYYKPDGTIKTYLIYNINQFMLNSDYAMCYYDGTPVVKTIYQSTAYTDISGHKYEKAITTLARYGITLKSDNGKFNPDKAVTEAEFASLVDSILYNDFYDASDVKSPALTRECAAKIIIGTYGDDLYLHLNGLFKQPYSDVSEDNEYIGHIAAAKALGFMKGKDDKFYPKSKITRGGAMQLIYNLINNYSNSVKIIYGQNDERNDE